MDDVLIFVWGGLIVCIFMMLQNSLKLLSDDQRERFLKERPFSTTYFWVLLAIFVGMSFVNDLTIAVTLAGLAIACAAYEHWKNSASMKRFSGPAEFKSRMVLMMWLADAVVVLAAADALLPYLRGT